jgi:opacity protein-like surface antigen
MRQLFVLTMLLGGAVCACAQVGEISASVGAARMSNKSLGEFAPGDVLGADANFRIGFRLTINSYKFFGHEFGYAYNHGKLKETVGGAETDFGMPIHQGMYNFLVYATPEGSTVRPFATGGVHFSTFYPPGASVFSGNGTTKFGFNYGAGVKFKVSSSFLGRLDFRDYVQGKPDFGTNPSGLLHLYEISAGVGFGF